MVDHPLLSVALSQTDGPNIDFAIKGEHVVIGLGPIQVTGLRFRASSLSVRDQFSNLLQYYVSMKILVLCLRGYFYTKIPQTQILLTTFFKVFTLKSNILIGPTAVLYKLLTSSFAKSRETDLMYGILHTYINPTLHNVPYYTVLFDDSSTELLI